MADTGNIIDAATATNVGNDQNDIKLTRNQRYHLLNREERNRSHREQYNNNPDVIAKREEKALKKAEREAERKAEKEAEKELKRQQKQLELKEKVKIALATKRPRKPKSEQTKDTPVGV
jgi:hypothetical protein